MKNKKVMFIAIIILILIVLSVVLAYFDKSRKANSLTKRENVFQDIDNIVNIIENNEIKIVENNKIQNENKIETIEESKKTEISNETEDNKKQQPVKQSKTTNKETVEKNKNQDTNKKQEVNKEEKKPSERTQPNLKPSSIQSTENKEETKENKEKTIENTPKCNHGNQKFYNTKAEAIATYESEVHKWSEKWTNYQIDDETYYKYCPIGYEIYSCPICEKWAISMYYND